jgi:drug/metabolite transporter (DMT)-like permease
MTPQNPTRSALPDRSISIAFLMFVIVSGSASVTIRMTYAELAPMYVAASRFVLAALAFCMMAFFKRIPLQKGTRVGRFAAVWSPHRWARVHTDRLGSRGHSGKPLPDSDGDCAPSNRFLSAVHGIESVSWRGVFGSLLAVGGIAFTAGLTMTSKASLPRMAAILLAAVFIAEGGVLIKKFPPNPPIVTNAIGMTVGGFILGVASLVSGEKWTLPTRTSTWIAFLYLVIFVTIVAFFLYLFVLGKWSASGSYYGFVLLPSAKKAAIVEECRDRSGQVLPRCV